jgi:Zn-dependent protease with chaperone function
MRIPFDLIAALLGLEAVRDLLARAYPNCTLAQATALDSARTSLAEALVALAAYGLVVWLAHELLARRAEWQTRWGRWPRGVASQPARLHPLQQHARGALLGQLLNVCVYLAFLWHYGWPLKTAAWPEWLGLEGWTSGDTRDMLRLSLFVGGLLDLGPFVLAMLLTWIPRRRLSARGVSLPRWLSFEARLTLLPLVLWLGLYLALDLSSALAPYRLLGNWAEVPWLAALAGIGLLVLVAAVLLPGVAVRLWQCRPMPEGPLKERLAALVARSGIRARAILSWGPRGSGFANACVLGPWGRLRYILISPTLAEALTPEECEAVLAHEIGHVRHGHLTLLICMVVLLAALGELALRLARGALPNEPLLHALVLLILLGAYLRLFFGAVSRRCEQEADLAAVELVGSPLPLVRSLEKISAMAGGIRDIYSWHHDSIGRRVERMLAAGEDPEIIRRQHAMVRRMRWALVCAAVLAVAALVGSSMTAPTPDGQPDRHTRASAAPIAPEALPTANVSKTKG